MSHVLAGVSTGFRAKSLGWPTFFAVSVLGAAPGDLAFDSLRPVGEGRSGLDGRGDPGDGLVSHPQPRPRSYNQGKGRLSQNISLK
jgi:hypothetical protein